MLNTTPQVPEEADLTDLTDTVICQIEGCGSTIYAFAICYKCGAWVPVCEHHRHTDAQILLLGNCLCLVELVKFSSFESV